MFKDITAAGHGVWRIKIKDVTAAEKVVLCVKMSLQQGMWSCDKDVTAAEKLVMCVKTLVQQGMWSCV